MENWYLQKGDQRLGPMTLDALQSMVASGQVAPTDLVWANGMPTWQPASSQPWFYNAPPPPPPFSSPSIQPSAPLFASQQPYAGEPPSLLGWSIAVLLCCCIPGGIVGIVYANKAKSEWARGNYVAAQAAYNTGKNWLIGSAIFGVVAYALSLLVRMNH